MYTLANQPPDLHYNVNDNCKNMLGPLYDGNVNREGYLNLLNDEAVP